MGGASKSSQSSDSRSSTDSFSNANTFVDAGQQPFLDQLRSAASGLVAGQQNIGAAASDISSGLFDQGQQAIGGLLAPGQNSAIGALQGFNPGSPQIQGPDFSQSQVGGVIDQLGTQINTQLQRQLGGAGGINSDAVLSGGLGGGRNQVERGIAQQGALDTFGRQAAGLEFQDLARRQGLQSQQGIAQAGFDQNNQQQMLQALTQSGQLQGQANQQGLAGNQAALNGLSGQFNLGLSPFAAAFQPLNNFADILGGPTVLSQARSQSTGRSRGQSQGSSVGFSAGG